MIVADRDHHRVDADDLQPEQHGLNSSFLRGRACQLIICSAAAGLL
jgi:hypothetical protein